MSFIFSPSNMDSYRKCPRRFQGQSITHEIQWKATEAKSRGTLVHNAIELAINEGIDKLPPVKGMNSRFVTQKITELEAIKSLGSKVYIEHELAVDTKYKRSGWWDADTLLRAKADALILHEEPSAPPLLIDFKTGRKWDTDAFQLRVETLLVHLLYDKPVIGYSYWYVDTGETVSDFVDFGSRGLDGVSDVVELMHEMQNAIKNNFFPAKRNKFCKWCDFYRTPLCTL